MAGNSIFKLQLISNPYSNSWSKIVTQPERLSFKEELDAPAAAPAGSDEKKTLVGVDQLFGMVGELKSSLGKDLLEHSLKLR